ncbi:protein of unknown function [Magnetospirillum sp. XM-1]|nr:protein of unknown function [Magnetospirillum sp. XM-1]
MPSRIWCLLREKCANWHAKMTANKR